MEDKMKSEELIKVEVLKLKPTQFTAGLKEVSFKMEKLNSHKESEVEDYLKEHPVPIVISPEDEMYLIDHHHLVRACWELGIHKVFAQIKHDFRKEEMSAFKKEMVKNNWVYLFDQFGNGPHEFHLLPTSIRGLADDSYRSLAWAVREASGFDKITIPFSEFKWAEFFRKHIKGNFTKDFEELTKEALKICSSPEASHLPGYKKKP
jgi:hypothetical protein